MLSRAFLAFRVVISSFFFFFLREGLFNEMMILLLRCGGALTWLSLQLVGVVVVAEEEDEI